MKKILMLLLALPTLLMAQNKVAVYVVSTSSVEEDIKEIVGSELVSNISRNKGYQASERTADFKRQVEDNQDDQQICSVAQSLGMDFVCVANISSFRDSYYLKARLLDSRRGEAIASSSEGSSLASIEDIIGTSRQIVRRLFGGLEPTAQEFSTGSTSSRNNCDLITIDNTGENTLAIFKLYSPNSTRWSIYQSTYIKDRATGNTYKLIDASGISTGASEAKEPGIHEFTLRFEKVPYNVTNIDIIEPKGWEWTNLVLKPYGKTGLHVFEDKVQFKFDALVREQMLMKQQEAQVGPIKNVVNTINSYLITVTNLRYTAYIVYLNDKELGVVDKRSTLTFRVSPTESGILKTVQRDGWLLSPQIFKFTVPPTRPGEIIPVTIPESK